MIPFSALLAPDHELPSIRLPTNTIKLISIPPLIFDAPLLLDISCPLGDLLTQPLGPLWNLSVLTQLQRGIEISFIVFVGSRILGSS
jgi:hypothetical protein